MTPTLSVRLQPPRRARGSQCAASPCGSAGPEPQRGSDAQPSQHRRRPERGRAMCTRLLTRRAHPPPRRARVSLLPPPQKGEVQREVLGDGRKRLGECGIGEVYAALAVGHAGRQPRRAVDVAMPRVTRR
eukprot:scaffold28756_cov59-Phaeocystis_antarctica.AAC.6